MLEIKFNIAGIKLQNECYSLEFHIDSDMSLAVNNQSPISSEMIADLLEKNYRSKNKGEGNNLIWVKFDANLHILPDLTLYENLTLLHLSKMGANEFTKSIAIKMSECYKFGWDKQVKKIDKVELQLFKQLSQLILPPKVGMIFTEAKIYGTNEFKKIILEKKLEIVKDSKAILFEPINDRAYQFENVKPLILTCNKNKIILKSENK